MTVTYITPDAEIDDLIARNKAGTAKIQQLLEESEPVTPPAPAPTIHWAWLLFGTGLGAGVVALTFGLS